MKPGTRPRDTLEIQLSRPGRGAGRAARGRALLSAALLLAFALALLPAAALAQTPGTRPTSLALAGPQEAPLSESVSLVAVLRDGTGRPIPGARIIFTSPARFGGTTGEMAVGEAFTDAQGAAPLDYQLRSQGANRFIARFYGDGTNQPAEASADVQATGLVQITYRRAGLPLPFLGWWTIIAVLWSVWTVYFIGMLQIFRLASAGSQHVSSTGHGGQPRSDTGGQR